MVSDPKSRLVVRWRLRLARVRITRTCLVVPILTELSSEYSEELRGARSEPDWRREESETSAL